MNPPLLCDDFLADVVTSVVENSIVVERKLQVRLLRICAVHLLHFSTDSNRVELLMTVQASLTSALEKRRVNGSSTMVVISVFNDREVEELIDLDEEVGVRSTAVFNFENHIKQYKDALESHRLGEITVGSMCVISPEIQCTRFVSVQVCYLEVSILWTQRRLFFASRQT